MFWRQKSLALIFGLTTYYLSGFEQDNPSQHQFVIYKLIKIISTLYDYYKTTTHSADPSKNYSMSN